MEFGKLHYFPDCEMMFVCLARQLRLLVHASRSLKHGVQHIARFQ